MLSLSKIQFKSNSQQVIHHIPEPKGCAQSIKDTIQKQFTTISRYEKHNLWLCSVYQRYNSKAIHNAKYNLYEVDGAVLSLSKIQFKSNSQLTISFSVSICRCAQSIKDTIQKQFTTGCITLSCDPWLCSVYQRYNSKAIHNWILLLTISNWAVLSLSKIQFKSNSQRRRNCNSKKRGCAQSIKDTIQKQFTTGFRLLSWEIKLCSVYQRYNSKAIHNQTLHQSLHIGAVLSLSKIQFKSNSQHCSCGSYS